MDTPLIAISVVLVVVSATLIFVSVSCLRSARKISEMISILDKNNR